MAYVGHKSFDSHAQMLFWSLEKATAVYALLASLWVFACKSMVSIVAIGYYIILNISSQSQALSCLLLPSSPAFSTPISPALFSAQTALL